MKLNVRPLTLAKQMEKFHIYVMLKNTINKEAKQLKTGIARTLYDSSVSRKSHTNANVITKKKECFGEKNKETNKKHSDSSTMIPIGARVLSLAMRDD